MTQGEYVECIIEKSSNESHEVHATEVTGILGGPLMCETLRGQRSVVIPTAPRGPPRGGSRGAPRGGSREESTSESASASASS